MRSCLSDWSDSDIEKFERLVHFEIEVHGHKDVLGWALQAVRTIKSMKRHSVLSTVEALCNELQMIHDERNG